MSPLFRKPAGSADARARDEQTLCAWISDDVLLIAPPPGTPEFEEPAYAAAARFAPAAEPAASSTTPALYAISAPEVSEAGGVPVDLATLLRERFALWAADSRRELLDFLASLGGEFGLTAALAEGLFEAREALRERLALALNDPRLDLALAVRSLHRLDQHRFYLHGSCSAPDGAVVVLTAVSPEGESVRLGARPHPLGGDEFVCRFETAAPSRRGDGWVLELRTTTGAAEMTSAVAKATPAEVRAAIAADVLADVSEPARLLTDHVRPALCWLQLLTRDAARVAVDEAFGEQVTDPAVSIVVATGDELELIEHQLVAFADDAELAECELLYVLDTPERREHASYIARELYELYGHPFRLLAPSADCGQLLAAELGRAAAAAPRLLFLDPTVMPSRHGWLRGLTQFYDATPGIGALAPKLLFQDEAIAHAGYGFERDEDGLGEWALQPYHRGLHKSLPAADVARPVPALSLACALIDADRLATVGGLEWLYLGREFADADLCLRLAAAGLDSWYLPTVELYDVEEGAIAPATSAERTYDQWLFGRLRGADLKSVQADPLASSFAS